MQIAIMQNARMEEKPAQAIRLELARITRGFKTAKDAATYFGWPYATYAQHELGQRGLSRAAKSYAKAFRVSEGWLLTGEGIGPEADGDTPPLAEAIRGQKIIAIPSDQIVSPGGAKLPVYSGAQGGNGKLIVGSDVIDRVEMPAVLRDVQGAYGLLVDGESMVPEFWPGDVAWVHPHLRPARGRNHILFHTPPLGEDAEAIIKRVVGWNDREWDLEQWNPAKTFKVYRQEWPICHRVVGKYEAA